MADTMAVQVTIYLNEADQWRHRPLHMEILNYLRQENVYAAIAFHAVAGFLGRQRVKTAHMVEAGGKLLSKVRGYAGVKTRQGRGTKHRS